MIVRTQTLIYASSLSNGRTKIKGPREIQFVAKGISILLLIIRTSSSCQLSFWEVYKFYRTSFSPSAQPVAVELVEGKLRDPQTSGDAIRQRFLDFYAARGHKVLPSASLVPDDPTVLLTIAGMLQFKPIFLGKVLHEIPNFKVVVYFYMRFPILQFDISPYAWQNFLGHQANMSMTYASEVP